MPSKTHKNLKVITNQEIIELNVNDQIEYIVEPPKEKTL